MAAPKRRSSDTKFINGKLAMAKEVFDFINSVGIGSFISIAVVAGAIAWFTGYMPTPWVTPVVFNHSQTEIRTLHSDQNAEMKKQTRLQNGLLCEHKSTDKLVAECYKNIQP